MADIFTSLLPADNFMNYFIQTFGCQANKADSERVAATLEDRGMKPARSIDEADHIVVNTCMIRASAEHRVYGLVHNLSQRKPKPKIVVTGCMVGMAARDTTGKLLETLKKRMPGADEFLPIEEVGFDHAPLRIHQTHAWVPISNGCNNYCTFCVVPYTRGREISRPYDEILGECHHLKLHHYTSVTLIGQNVNSYGADLLMGAGNIQTHRDLEKSFFNSPTLSKSPHLSVPLSQQPANKPRPVFVKHLGRFRIPTLFPALLEQVALIGFETVSFISSNPWDFSDELIDVIARYPNISREIHLPLQSGDNQVLNRMNRWYTREEYMDLIGRMRKKIPGVTISTDIIVGFCGETDEEFKNTVDVCKQVGFSKAYLAMYSDRPMTAAHKTLKNDIPHPVKKIRWETLERLVNGRHHASV